MFFPDSKRVADHVADNHEIFNRFIRSERRDIVQQTYSTVDRVTRYKILYPKEDSERIFRDFDFKQIEKELNSAADRKHLRLTAFAHLAAGYRLAFPKHFAGFEIVPVSATADHFHNV